MINKKIQVLIALVSISILFFVVDFKVLGQAISQLSLPIIFLLILISIVLVYISALKWQLFLASLGENISAIYLFSLYLVGYFVNLIAPSYLGGDAVRSFFAGKKIGQHRAIAATILERYSGLAAMLSLAVVFVWFVDVNYKIKITIILLMLGLIFGTVLALSPKLIRIFSKIKFFNKFQKHIEKVQEGFYLVRRDHSLLVKALLLSYLFHTFTVLNVFCTALAIGWNSCPFWELFVVVPIILLIGAVPVTPSGLGIQEGAFYFFLTRLGATPEQALLIALILRAKNYLLALFGGTILLFKRSELMALNAKE